MKTKLIATALFALTAVGVAAYPIYKNTPIPLPPQQTVPNQAAKIDVVFVLDTTGSMGGLIQAAKEKIWSIASSMAQARPAPEIRMGLVAYRDRGDAYVTRVVDLSSDLDTMYATLMDFQANGGGDGPESVNQALNEAVNKMSWHKDNKTYKAIFLVGDAPPHMDYQDDVKYPQTLALAKQKGIVVNAIQCGRSAQTQQYWQQIAQLGNGDYFQVDQAGSAVAIATPYDKTLAELSRKLDDTRMVYGSKEEKAAFARKQAATEKLHDTASDESQARRAAFNASGSGKTNLLGKQDLVEDVSSGRVELKDIDKAALPAAVAAMSPAEQKAMIASKAKERKDLQAKIGHLAKERDAFIRKKVEASGGAKGSLDARLFESVRSQAAAKGLHYEAEAPAY
ncbi:MAG: VWA domain-containing protein [Gammaproteobacteria bacterium]|nr:VWA domain-containing protein [Gammaproteobacteria bacterium]